MSDIWSVMVNELNWRSRLQVAASMLVLVAIGMFSPSVLRSQSLHAITKIDRPTHSSDPASLLQSIDDLMHERLDRERAKYGKNLVPAFIRLEANYVRTDEPTGEVVLHEASFSLHPRYMAYSPAGRPMVDSVLSDAARRPVMYFIGSARTPLSLPLVSNLSKVLSGEE